MSQGWWRVMLGSALVLGCALQSQRHEVVAPDGARPQYGTYYRAMLQQGFEQVQGDEAHGALRGAKHGVLVSVVFTGTTGVVTCTRQGSQIPIGPATVCAEYLKLVRAPHE